jgi:hypothetical protein
MLIVKKPSPKVIAFILNVIPKPFEDARFRTSERFMIKAPLFIKGYSLKKGGNEEHGLLIRPRRTGLEALYAALLISTIE